ncbi:NAD dependent oxidoreductase [Pseudohyphozyma bogoriensis]|nr:NAD dependent oxidoreductase [Pseudohyphozyma bogoriensis]
MSDKVHNIALLGAGLFATGAHLPNIAAASPPFVLKAVYSRSSASAVSLAEAALAHPSLPNPLPTYFDVASEGVTATSAGNYDDLLARKDIETVVVCLPIPVQPSVIEKAWKAGKNVISEKPVAPTVGDAKKLIELWEKEYKPKGLNWIICEQYPFEESFEKARQLIADGKIGELRTFHLDVSVHMPAVGTFNISYAAESSAPGLRNYVFRGSKATLTVEMVGVTARKLTLAPTAGSGEETTVLEFDGDAIRAEFAAFASALVEGVESERAKDVDAKSGPRAALRDLEIIEKALNSGESGQWETLEA